MTFLSWFRSYQRVQFEVIKPGVISDIRYDAIIYLFAMTRGMLGYRF